MNSFYSQQAGCTVRWQDLPGHGDPVVFIHGLGCASSYEYPRVVCDPQFGARRAILIDLPGSGYSDKPEHFSYRTCDQALVVVELLTHLILDAFWLYGHSMGGSIAIETATLIQHRLRGLIVSEPNAECSAAGLPRRRKPPLSRADMPQCWPLKPHPGRGAWAVMRHMLSGAGRRRWSQAFSPTGPHNFWR